MKKNAGTFRIEPDGFSIELNIVFTIEAYGLNLAKSFAKQLTLGLSRIASAIIQVIICKQNPISIATLRLRHKAKHLFSFATTCKGAAQSLNLTVVGRTIFSSKRCEG